MLPSRQAAHGAGMWRKALVLSASHLGMLCSVPSTLPRSTGAVRKRG